MLKSRNPLGGSFGFHYAEMGFAYDNYGRNPLGGSFGFHRVIIVELLHRKQWVAIPLAGLLVSTEFKKKLVC